MEVYVDKIKTRINGKTYQSVLLRESYREGAKVKKRTIANLSELPDDIVDVVAAMLKGANIVVAGSDFSVDRSLAHGHVAAVVAMIRKLKLHKIVRTSKTDLLNTALALIAARVIRPRSKLGTVRWWRDTTLGELLKLPEGVSERQCYEAMDWLYSRQQDIEKKLATRHLKGEELVLYDLTSVYLEGSRCPLARRGYSRDKKRGKLQIQMGLLTDGQGRPVATEVFDGNILDRKTLRSQLEKLRQRFGIDQITVVGDRGMITKTEIEVLQHFEGVRYITAMRSSEIRDLRVRGLFQPSLFDQRNLAEIIDPQRPNERLVVCHNPLMAERRRRKRESMLQATEALLDKLRATVGAGRLKAEEKIALRAGSYLNRYKMAKHFSLSIREGYFDYARREDRIAAESDIDGYYVIRSNLGPGEKSCHSLVETYKRLAYVERAFRSIKTVDLHVRPVHHRLEHRVRAHVFLCMLAYYVVWHLRDAWSSLLYAEDDLHEVRLARDPVAKAAPSTAARGKKNRKVNGEGQPLLSFRGLIDHLGSLSRLKCSYFKAGETYSFWKDSNPTPTQQAALGHVESYTAAF